MLRRRRTTVSHPGPLAATSGYPPHPMQTRYLIMAALVTALVILAASVVWFLRVAS